jgi:ADP-ribose pyrophosphatase YjhB (NUDIX family)
MADITKVLSKASNPRKGLPEDIFLLISQLTPMMNVELLIKDEKLGTLLTWRHDEFYGPAWHLPGGIIRFKEFALTRINKVAQSELGAAVVVENDPIEVHEIMNDERDIRGHFISLLYQCKLKSDLKEDLKFSDESPVNGYWRWFRKCPENLLSQHERYRKRIGLNNT